MYTRLTWIKSYLLPVHDQINLCYVVRDLIHGLYTCILFISLT